MLHVWHPRGRQGSTCAVATGLILLIACLALMSPGEPISRRSLLARKQWWTSRERWARRHEMFEAWRAGELTGLLPPDALSSAREQRKAFQELTMGRPADSVSHATVVQAQAIPNGGSPHSLCSGMADSWDVPWGTPSHACAVWAANSQWGALGNHRTFAEGCATAWGQANCAATCCCAGVTDTWKTNWATPSHACASWAANSQWGALQQGQTLAEGCASAWGQANCAATCLPLLSAICSAAPSPTHEGSAHQCPSGYTMLCSAVCPGDGAIAGVGGGAQLVSGIEVCASECSSTPACTSFVYGIFAGDGTNGAKKYCSLNTCAHDELVKRGRSTGESWCAAGPEARPCSCVPEGRAHAHAEVCVPLSRRATGRSSCVPSRTWQVRPRLPFLARHRGCHYHSQHRRHCRLRRRCHQQRAH